MGLWDALLGRSTPPRADLDALFAVPQAAVTLQTQGFAPTGRGAVCYRSGDGGAFAAVEQQVEQLLATDGTQVERTDDSYGFRWFSVTRPGQDVAGLVTDLHAVNTSLRDAGFDQALLCSTVVFDTPAGQHEAARLALVYLYKRGTFYPFAPAGTSRRDNALELQVRGLVGADLLVESDLARWLAIWGAPGL